VTMQPFTTVAGTHLLAIVFVKIPLEELLASIRRLAMNKFIADIVSTPQCFVSFTAGKARLMGA